MTERSQAKLPAVSGSPPIANSSPTFIDVAKSEFLLLGAFLLLLGIISTDAYYRSFGLRFQFLSYPWNLIIFRGLLTVVRFPPLWLLVGMIVIVIEIDRVLASATKFPYQRWRISIVYTMAAILVACMPRLGTFVGSKEAAQDMRWQGSTLPRIYKIVASDGTEQHCDSCLLLLMDSSQVVYFSGLTDGGMNDLPRTKILARSAIQSIETTR